MNGSSADDPQTRQFISFTIGEEEYGADIMGIREIKGWTDTTQLPNTPEHLRGVMNLRGAIIPVFDLRARFGGGQTHATPRHVTMVVTVGSRVLGMLVDTVADIITVSAGHIQPVPEAEAACSTKFLSGLVSVDGRMVALLNLHELFETELDALAMAQ